MDRRHKARGVRATAVHSGGIQPELGRHMTPEVRERLIATINASRPKGAAPFSYKTIPQGAATPVDGPARGRTSENLSDYRGAQG